MTQQINSQSNEIDLGEYFKFIFRSKKIILAGLFLSLIPALIWNSMSPKIYEVTSVLQLGRINGEGINKDEAKALILRGSSLEQIIKKTGISIKAKDLLNSIKLEDIQGTPLLRISLISSDANDALKLNNAIVRSFIEEGEIFLNKKTDFYKKKLAGIDTELRTVEKNLAITQSVIVKFINLMNVPQSDGYLRVVLLQNLLYEYETKLERLKTQRNEVELIFTTAQEFKLFDPPVIPHNPIGSKKMRNIIAFGFIGLIFGVFSASIGEYLQRNKTIFK